MKANSGPCVLVGLFADVPHSIRFRASGRLISLLKFELMKR